MFRLGIIKESIKNIQILNDLGKYYYSQREEFVPDDECPHWHIFEYRISNDDIIQVLDTLKDNVKETWYIHAFNEEKLYVVLIGKYFELPLKRDRTWKEMIRYGKKVAMVKKKYLKDIPLHI